MRKPWKEIGRVTIGRLDVIVGRDSKRRVHLACVSPPGVYAFGPCQVWDWLLPPNAAKTLRSLLRKADSSR